MSHEVKIHDAQTSILRELLFHASAGFAELQRPTGLDSDHFKFHIHRLVELGYVKRNDSARYALTAKGKEHANKLDTDTNTIERQPKLSVCLIVRSKEDPEKYLVQQRLKNPYFGFWGRLGGKIRWGESFEEAAGRELTEETGLTGTFAYRYIVRKRDYKKATGELLEDKVFVMMEALDYQGELIEAFEGGKNAWMTQEELVSQEKHFSSAHNFVELLGRNTNYVSMDYRYGEDEY